MLTTVLGAVAGGGIHRSVQAPASSPSLPGLLNDTTKYIPANYNSDVRPNPASLGTDGNSYSDTTFNSTIYRLTNVGEAASDDDWYGHCWFSATGKYFFYKTASSGLDIRLTADGSTVEAAITEGIRFDLLWHPTDDEKYYRIDAGSGIKECTVGGSPSPVTVYYPGATMLTMGGSQNWIDKTARYFVYRTASGVGVYDRTDAEVMTGTLGTFDNWCGITPSGNTLILGGGTPQSHVLNHGTNTIGSALQIRAADSDHFIMVSGSDGNDYAIIPNSEGSGVGGIFRMTVDRNRSGQSLTENAGDTGVLKLLDEAVVPNSWDWQVTHAPVGAQDWVFFATEAIKTSGIQRDYYDDVPDTDNTWATYKQEIIGLNYITGDIRRYCHHRSRSMGDPAYSSWARYYFLPRPTCSWDGNILAWMSNFNHAIASTGYADAYCLKGPLV